MNEKRVRDALRASSSTETHLSEDTWEALACGELDEEARLDALDHITSCAECDRIFRALRNLHAEARAFDPEVPELAPGSAPILVAPIPMPAAMAQRQRRALYAAASLAAAALVAIVLLMPRAEPPPTPTTVLRNGAPAQAGPTPIPLFPAGRLIEPPTSLTWTPVSDAESYRVEFYATDGSLLWSVADLQTTEIPWPEIEVADVRAWRVFAIHSGGLRQAAGRAVEIELVPDGLALEPALPALEGAPADPVPRR